MPWETATLPGNTGTAPGDIGTPLVTLTPPPPGPGTVLGKLAQSLEILAQPLGTQARCRGQCHTPGPPAQSLGPSPGDPDMALKDTVTSLGPCHPPGGSCHISRSPLTLLGTTICLLGMLSSQALHCTVLGTDNRSPHTCSWDSPMTQAGCQGHQGHVTPSSLSSVSPQLAHPHTVWLCCTRPCHHVTVQSLSLSRSPACRNVG